MSRNSAVEKGIEPVASLIPTETATKATERLATSSRVKPDRNERRKTFMVRIRRLSETFEIVST